MASKELIGQMDFLKQLLSNLLAVLMLDTNGLGQTWFGFYKTVSKKKKSVYNNGINQLFDCVHQS